jgi:Mg-chelatase subunit ChlD
MSRRLAILVAWLAFSAVASAADAQLGNLKVQIREPVDGLELQRWETEIDVEGGASIFGGVKHLDLFLVLDASGSLGNTDPDDYRAAAAIALVRSLSPKSDIRLGLVEFDSRADLEEPLTGDRAEIIHALEKLGRHGGTNLADGIETALTGFEADPRPETSRVMLLFTDGKSNADRALRAMEKARDRQVAIHTLQLGDDERGAEILKAIADGTGGSFIRVTDPSELPDAFLNLRTTGIEGVALRVNGSDPIPAAISGAGFSARVPLRAGANEIVATATSLDGRTRDAAVTVFVSGPLRISIDTPLDGTLYVEREGDAVVEGTVGTLTNPSPEFLARYPNRGVRNVVLTVNDSPPFATTLRDGRFRGRILLEAGENRIVATASGVHGGTAQDQIGVTVRAPGCAELQIEATRNGTPALSISDRAVEIVFDASNSMWGQIDGRPKISIAKETLEEALEWLPSDLALALRVYGHQHDRRQRNCEDSQLLVPPGSHNRARIRQAIAGFRPKGQTPLGYSLEQIASDLGGFAGERAVVLVTDGIESCGGDPTAAARSLRRQSGAPVHVIGFGMGGGADEDLAGLQSIAEASGGQFLTAGTAEELRDALRMTVGTSFRVSHDGALMAIGTLGTSERIRLPANDYVVEFDSTPPHVVPLTLRSEESLTLSVARTGKTIANRELRRPAAYDDCEAEFIPVGRQRGPARFD